MLLFVVWALANQISSDPSSEMVNKIILHAQHILWAQSCSACHRWHFSPRNLLFHKRRKGHLCHEPKRIKKEIPFSLCLFEGEAEGYENHFVFWFWTDFHFHGHLREVKFLGPSSWQEEERVVTGTQTPQNKRFSNNSDTHVTLYPRSLSQTKINYNMGGKVFFLRFKACNSLLRP